MKTIFRNFIISSIYLGNKESPFDKDNWNCNRIRIYNRQNKKSLVFDFWRPDYAPKVENRTELLGVFKRFLYDALSSRRLFKEFCVDFGYSDDSIKALNLYKLCIKSWNSVHRITSIPPVDIIEGIDNDYSN